MLAATERPGETVDSHGAGASSLKAICDGRKTKQQVLDICMRRSIRTDIQRCAAENRHAALCSLLSTCSAQAASQPSAVQT
jgi:hypothetical protein